MSDTEFSIGPSPFRSQKERDEERAQKREAILLAAVRMFNARGFHATSLDEVAASLGVSKPTIYHYLGNKDQVLLECLTRGLERLQEAASKARAQPGTGLDRLQVFLRLYAEINMTDFGRCVIRTDASALSPDSAERFRSLKRQIDTAMRGLIAEGVADGSIKQTDVRLAAFVLAGALNWPAFWFRQDGDTPAADLAEHMVDLLTTGIAPRSG
ncbi:TetR/AcrR family transcriptional regulator [Rhodoligotrophos defluvii]|uniref:TetR/AcrR family transcriptional regulator n=1 Tax=Rhodoligotrophos defluvii TaxID=2561934 RepID=UPI001EEF7EC8|nr:TetR/AcrR family transcriptional regulator [Rhodoligotrophos defluvii]